MRITKASSIHIPLFLLIACIGMGLLRFAAKDGVAVVGNDSVCYLDAASNIKNGHGYTFAQDDGKLIPWVHFPPLFPMAIAGVGLFAENMRLAATDLQIALYGANLLLVCLLVFRNSGSTLLGAAAGLIFLASQALFELHVGILSEPLFLFLGMLALLAITEGINRKSNGYLAVSALLFGLAVAARYAGVVWIGVGALSVFLLIGGSRVRRFLCALWYGCLASLPLAAVIIRNKYVTRGISLDKASSFQSFNLHPVSTTHIKEALTTIACWVLPWRLVGWLSGLIVLLLGLACFSMALKLRREERAAASGRFLTNYDCILLLFLLFYIVEGTVSISFLDFSTPLDERILAPAALSVLLLLPLFARTASGSTSSVGRPVFWAACAWLILFGFARTIPQARQIRRAGRGYTAASDWLQDDAMLELKKAPPGTPIFATSPGDIHGRLGLSVKMIPVKKNEISQKSNPDLDKEIEAMRKTLKEHPGFVAYIYHGNNAQSVPSNFNFELSEQELTEMLPLRLVVRTKHAALYKLNE